MYANSALVYSAIKRRYDPYLVGHRWRILDRELILWEICELLSMQSRRWLTDELPKPVDFTYIGSHLSGAEDVERRCEAYLDSIPPFWPGVRIAIVESDSATDLIILAHHYYFDGFSFWRMARSVLIDPGRALEDLERARGLDVSKRLGKHIPSRRTEPQLVESFTIAIDSNVEAYRIAQIVSEGIKRRLLDERLVGLIRIPSRKRERPTDEVGSFVEYSDIGTEQISDLTASLNLDVFAGSIELEGLRSLGAYPRFRRESIDVLIEELDRCLRISIISSETSKDIRHRLHSALCDTLRTAGIVDTPIPICTRL